MWARPRVDFWQSAQKQNSLKTFVKLGLLDGVLLEFCPKANKACPAKKYKNWAEQLDPAISFKKTIVVVFGTNSNRAQLSVASM